MMNLTQAIDYWRVEFADAAKGYFTTKDFDKWFRNGALGEPNIGALTNFPGSKEHFSNLVHVTLMSMLEASMTGRFKD